MRTTAKENAGRKSPDAWECRSVWRPWPWLPPEALVEFGIGGTAPLNSCRSPVRRQLQPGNKMVLGLPLAHIASYFADNRHRRHHVDAVDLGQVRTCHAKQLFPQIKLWIAFLLLAPSFRVSSGKVAPWVRSSRCARYLGPFRQARRCRTVRVDPNVSRRGACDRGIRMKPLAFCGGCGGLYLYSMGIQWPFRNFIASGTPKCRFSLNECFSTVRILSSTVVAQKKS